MNIKPLFDRVVVKPIKEKTDKIGNIILPESSKQPDICEVIALGTGKIDGKEVEFEVKVGDKVDEGSILGVEGTSGDAEYRHLHFEVSTSYDRNTRIDPTPYLTNAIANKPYKMEYQAHVQGVGWQCWVGDGETSGTTGRALRLEGLHIKAPFEIEASAHIEKMGWVNYGKINKDTLIGTEGQSRRLECLKFKGNFKYRVYIQNLGWSAWTNADGISTLGSVGQSLRIEAVEMLPL